MRYVSIFLTLVAIFFVGCKDNKTDKENNIEESLKSWPLPVNGTTGTPLGGVGTGAVKYCAWTGIINAFTDMSPAGMQRYNKHVTLGEDARFQFYSSRKGEKIVRDTLNVPQVDGYYDDDAVFPLHLAKYGVINGVDVSMTGFCPWDTDDFEKMCLPYAFYEFTLSNHLNSSVDVAVAMNINFENNPVFIEGKGLADNSGPHMKAVYVKSDCPGYIITAGNDAGFFNDGQCNNEISNSKNRVVVKMSLGAKEKRVAKFVLSWYKINDYGKYYYENFYLDAGSVADAGLNYFDGFKNKAIAFVDGMRSSNVPAWMTNYLLNTLSNMTNNSVYAKDGRACMAEGEFNILGTIDEYWQARSVLGSNLMPEFTWREMEYWARTQFRGTYEGQIHHDFGINGHGVTDEDLCAWDDHDHEDYRSRDDVVSWPDTNVGFIVGVYETFIATDDHEKLSQLWPYLKKTGLRLIAQKEAYGDPANPWAFETSHNMYDAGGYCQTYSTGTAILAYRCMTLLAGFMDDKETQEFYDNAETETIKAFEKKYLAKEYKFIDKHCEGALAGPWFSQCLKFDQFDTGKVDKYIYDVLERYYNPVQDSMGFPEGTYNEWPQHLVGHFGGYAFQQGKIDEAIALWKDMYNRGYIDRNRVFNLPISLRGKASPNFAAKSIDGYYQYTSRPSTWRIYQDMIGYFRNKHTGEIWLEPILLPEMNHQLEDAFFISAEGNGTISYYEKGKDFAERTIILKPDNELKVTSIYIKDQAGSPEIKVDDVPVSWTRTGPPWKQRIKIDLNETVGKEGLCIDIANI